MDWFWMLLLIGLAGGLGAVIRSVLVRWDGWLPYGLIASNSLAAGLVAWWLSGPTLTADYTLVITVGFAGGLSTFSTVAKSGFDFYHHGRILQSLISLLANLFVPLGAVLLATALR